MARAPYEKVYRRGLTTTEADARYAPLGSTGGSGVTDHGALSGLADDDHPQYLTQTEADALYDATGAASSAVAAHVAASDPHPTYLTAAEGNAAYAPLAKGVTNGDSHDHNGGDGAQIAYSSLSGLPTLGTAAAQNTTAFEAAGAVAAHEADTTSVHGIADTSALLDTADIGVSVAAASHTHAAGDITSGTMATARLGSGSASSSTFLRGDQTWAAPTASVAGTTVEQNLGSEAMCCGKTTVTDASVSASSKILCWQAPGPYTGKGSRADEAAMQPVQVIAVEPGTGSFVIHWQTPPMITSGRTEEMGLLTPVGATFDRLINQRLPKEFTPRRLGRVRGNVKFTYMILA